MQILVEENPYMAYHKKSQKHRNPVASVMPRNLTQGIGAQEIFGAALGLAAATFVPNALLKSGTGGKLGKVLLAYAAAFGAGWVAKMVAGPAVGKATAIGGVAGATGLLLQAYTPLKITGNPALSAPSYTTIGASVMESNDSVKTPQFFSIT